MIQNRKFCIKIKNIPQEGHKGVFHNGNKKQEFFIMINKNKLKALIRKIGKRPSKEAVEKINKLLDQKAKEIINRAKRKTDFSGRKTIIKEDIEE